MKHFIKYTIISFRCKINSKVKLFSISRKEAITMGFKMPKGIDKVPMTIRVNEKNFDFIKK